MVFLVNLNATIEIKLGTAMQHLLVRAFKDNKQDWGRAQIPPDHEPNTDTSAALAAEASFVLLGWAFTTLEHLFVQKSLPVLLQQKPAWVTEELAAFGTYLFSGSPDALNLSALM